MATSPSERPTNVRHLVVLATTLMAVLLYLDRLCVGIASNYIREDLGLTQTQIAQFLGAFFWSYALGQVPSGWFSDRYGARIMLVIYILSWSVFTAMVGAATGFLLLWWTRFGVGLGQAGAYPTAGGLISKWVPFSSRGGASSMVALGGRFGGVAAPILTAYLMVLFTPLSVPATVTEKDLLNSGRLCARLAPPRGTLEDWGPEFEKEYGPSAIGFMIWDRFPLDVQLMVRDQGIPRRPYPELQVLDDDEELVPQAVETPPPKRAEIEPLADADRKLLLQGLNTAVAVPDLYGPDDWTELQLDEPEANRLLKRREAGETLSQPEIERLNRLVLEAAFPGDIARLYGHGWRPVMLVYGLAGVVVAGMFWFCFRNHPDQHPWCNAAERELIVAGRPDAGACAAGASSGLPVRAVLTSVSLWLNCAMQITTNIGWLFLVTWLPRYLTDVHKVSLAESGLMTAIPTGVGIAGMFIGGRLTDRLVPRIGLRWGRRAPMMFTRFTAGLGYVLCLVFATAGDVFNNPWWFVGALSLVALSVDMGNPAVWAFCQDVGGRNVGSILGWGNMWGNFGAAVAPSIYNAVLGESPSLADWNIMFRVCLGAFVLSGLCAWGVDATQPVESTPEKAQS